MTPLVGTRPAPERPPLERIGDFVLDRRLGAGAMGEVFLARDLRSGEVLALKLARARGGTERMRREAALLTRVRHQNVVSLRQAGEADGRNFLALEYVEGHDLEEELREGRRPPLEQALRLLVGLASGLAAIHAQGIVHRDLKPQNVRVTPDGTPKLMDFGLGVGSQREEGERGPQAPPVMLPVSGVWGSPAYMSPEALEGGSIGAASDVYALGVVMFRLLSGQLPFQAEDPLALAELHLTAPVPSLRAIDPALPPALDALCGRLLHKDPAARPDAGAVLAELRGVVDERARAARGSLWQRLRAWWSPPPPPPLAERAAERKAATRRMTPPPEQAPELAVDLGGAVPPGPVAEGAPLGRAEQTFLTRLEARLAGPRLNLPMLPRTTLDVLALLGDARAAARDAARLVAADPVLAAEVLRVANSAALGARETPDPAQAVVRIGLRRLRVVLLEVTARALILRGDGVSELAQRTWRHSIACAVFAGRLAALAGEDREACYTAGLLHDVGMIPILEAWNEQCREGLRPDERVLRLALARWHERLGARVAEALKLPELVAQAAGAHGHAQAPASRGAALVALADQACASATQEALRACPQLPACGLPEGALERFLEQLPDALQEIDRRLNG